MTNLKTENLLSTFVEHNIPIVFKHNARVLIGVSGGVDSMVLIDLCKKVGLDIHVAHCNFGLRDNDSERDAFFVKKFCEENNLPVYIKKFDTKTYCKQYQMSIQEGARELRYKWFFELIHDLKLDYILTAHHQNDQIETILINFFKGSGIKGLRGIIKKQNQLIRPLLHFSKNQIIAFAKENHLVFREDKSNLKDEYTRNFIRLNIIPQLQKVFPSIEQNIINNSHRFKEIEAIYNEHIDFLKKKLILKSDKNQWEISIKNILKENNLNSILYELFKNFGIIPPQIIELEKLLHATTGKFLKTSSYQFTIYGKKLIITKLEKGSKALPLYINKENEVSEIAETIGFNFEFINTSPLILKQPNTLFVNGDELLFPLELRHWDAGDYFYPLGLNKKKKLKKFFNDKKIFLLDKKKIWILLCNKKIVAVLGYAIDERFKILPSTKKILKITWQNHIVETNSH